MNTITTTKKTISALCLAGAVMLGGAAGVWAQAPQAMVSSSWSITRSEDGKTYTVSSADGKLSASVDGQAVPAERVRNENGKVSILDEQGGVVFEQDSPDAGITVLNGNDIRGLRGLGGVGGPDRRGFRINGQASRGNAAAAKLDEPKVMVGVQLIEPDATIRGHFDLKEGDATMVAAVYEGLPAQKAGLKPYDLIVAIDGKSPASSTLVRETFRTREAGQAIGVDVLRKGVKQTIVITPEKYDAAKMDGAKVDAIATADDWGNLSRGGNNLGIAGGQPFMWTIPAPGGRAQMLIGPEHAQIQRQAEDMARQLQQRMGVVPGGPGMPGNLGNMNPADLNKAIEERMRRMEEMMQRMMERQNGAPAPAAPGAKKDEKTSRRDLHVSSWKVS